MKSDFRFIHIAILTFFAMLIIALNSPYFAHKNQGPSDPVSGLYEQLKH